MPVQTKQLTTVKVESAKAVKNTRTEFPDGGNGLALVVQPTGAKSWIIRFRVRGRGKVKATLGSYPTISLKEARERLRDARQRADDGGALLAPARPAASPAVSLVLPAHDVIEGSYTVVALPGGLTVGQAWSRYLVEHLAKAKGGSMGGTYKRFKGLFEKHILPGWRDRVLTSVSRDDVRPIVNAAKLRGPEARNSTIVVLSSFFNWAADPDQDLIKSSPVDGFKKTEEKSRERALLNDEIRVFWKGCTELGPIFGPMLQLLLLTGARRGEVSGMKYSELDLEKRVWTIPGSRTKNGMPLAVYLTDQMLAVLNTMPKIEGRDHVFSRYDHSAASGYSKAKTDLDKLAPLPHWTIHDLRRTFVSGLAALKVPTTVIEKCVNHLSGELAGVAGIYNVFAYLDEKTAAWKLWSDHITDILIQQSDERLQTDLVSSVHASTRV